MEINFDLDPKLDKLGAHFKFRDLFARLNVVNTEHK
jgi:hypothetical protein